MQVQNGHENKVITIYDIAREAGVSTATVSRVLTNSAKVRPEKQERVMQLVKKYNFTPNALARGLSDTRSKVIGILAADVRNPYYAELFVACEKAAHEAGYTVLLTNTRGDKRQERYLLGKFKEQRVDALIQLGGNADTVVTDVEYAKIINQIMANTPTVVTGKLDGTQCRMVRVDSTKAMDLLMEHLLSLGHQRIALIGGRMDVMATHEKFIRYQEVLKLHGISYDPDLVAEDSDYDMESGYRLMNRMFEKGVDLTAVIAVNDFAATGIIRSIFEYGYRIPEDISVVSYDNTYIAHLMIPALTSIDYNYEEYGRKLVQAAIQAIEGEEMDVLQMVTPKLVVRESSGAAPKK